MAHSRLHRPVLSLRGNNRALLRTCLQLVWIIVLIFGPSRELRAQAIFDAVKKGDVTAVQRMLAANAQQAVTATDDEGHKPLHWAAVFGHTDIMRLLIDAGADVNATNTKNGWTPLHEAAWHAQTDAIDLLIRHGARLDLMTDDGFMPIHKAAHNGQPKSIVYLLMYGAEVDARNRDGNTPLAVAALYGQMDACKLLIAAGADIHSKNSAGSTPIDEAVRGGKNDIALLMKSYDDEQQLQAARVERLTANPLSIRTSYANWLDQKAVAKTIYHQDFSQDKPGREWSTTPLPGAAQAPLHVSSTPRGHRRFLGDFGSQVVHLNLRALPTHHEVAVSFELFIINSWDGNDLRAGPDIWRLSIEDGPTLLNTTFANTCDGRRSVYMPDQLKNVKVQAYPDEYPGGHNPLYTGADEVNTLGYMFNLNGTVVPMDAVYKMRYTFRSSDSDITLNFAAHGLEALDNESWGIANVEASVDSLPVAIIKPIIATPRPTTNPSKPKPIATRSTIVHAALRSPHKSASAKHKASSAHGNTRSSKKPAAGQLHDKKKPLTP